MTGGQASYLALLGLPTDAGLEYFGKVGTGFSDTARQEMLEALRPLVQKKSPFARRPSPAETARARFVCPMLVGEVQFAEWTSNGHLRHPSWRRLRPDKDAGEVVRES